MAASRRNQGYHANPGRRVVDQLSIYFVGYLSTFVQYSTQAYFRPHNVWYLWVYLAKKIFF